MSIKYDSILKDPFIKKTILDTKETTIYLKDIGEIIFERSNYIMDSNYIMINAPKYNFVGCFYQEELPTILEFVTNDAESELHLNMIDIEKKDNDAVITNTAFDNKNLVLTIPINIFASVLRVLQEDFDNDSKVVDEITRYKNILTEWIQKKRVYSLTITNLYDDKFISNNQICVKVEVEFNNKGYEDVIYGYTFKTIVRINKALDENSHKKYIVEQLANTYDSDVEVYFKNIDLKKDHEKYMKELQREFNNHKDKIYEMPEQRVKEVLDKIGIPFSEFKKQKEFYEKKKALEGKK